MNPGPLRRATGAVGLIALIPTAFMLTLGTVGPLDAALRGGATFGAVLVIGRTACWWLGSVASRFERQDDTDAAAGGDTQRVERRAAR